MLRSRIVFISNRRLIILAIDTASLNKAPLYPPHFSGELCHHEASNIVQGNASTAGLEPAGLLVLFACFLKLLR